MKNALMYISLLCLTAMVSAIDDSGLAAAADASVTTAALHDFGTDAPPRHGTTTLYRNDNGIAVTVDTRHLRKNSAHTFWFIIFNKPENCATLPCGPDDLQNAMVMPSVVFGGAFITGRNGKMRVSSGLTKGVAPMPPVRAGFGPGVLSPHTAEVHIVVQDHLGVDLDEIHEMLQLPGAGPNGVEDVQSSIHLP